MSYLLFLGPLVQHILSKVKFLRQWLLTAIYGFKVSKSQRGTELVIFVKVPACWLGKPDESEWLVAEKQHDSQRALSTDVNMEIQQPVGRDKWRGLVSLQMLCGEIGEWIVAVCPPPTLAGSWRTPEKDPYVFRVVAVSRCSVSPPLASLSSFCLWSDYS